MLRWKNKRELFFKETEELRQVYNLQPVQVTEHKVLIKLQVPYSYNKRKGKRSFYEIWMIITKGTVTMPTAGPHKISSPSSKFFSARSKFPDVPLFRPNLFIKDDSRVRGCHSTVKPAKKSFFMVMFHHSISNFLCYLSSIITYSAVNIIWAVSQPHTMGSPINNGVIGHKH